MTLTLALTLGRSECTTSEMFDSRSTRASLCQGTSGTKTARSLSSVRVGVRVRVRDEARVRVRVEARVRVRVRDGVRVGVRGRGRGMGKG